MRMPAREEQRLLHAVGFPISVDGNFGPRSRQARRDFKRGAPRRYRRSRRLYERRLRWSVKNSGKVSEHFFYSDWKSNGNGWIKCNRVLVKRLELYRRRSGKAVGILSGYRDPVWNARIGGSKFSMHMFGAAVDFAADGIASLARACGFSGIGVRGSNQEALRHGDVRGQGGAPNFTGGKPHMPTVWTYAN